MLQSEITKNELIEKLNSMPLDIVQKALEFAEFLKEKYDIKSDNEYIENNKELKDSIIKGVSTSIKNCKNAKELGLEI